MTLCEQIYNSIPLYPEHATVHDMAKTTGISERRIRSVMLSMNGSLPVAEYHGRFTRINDDPYIEGEEE